MPLATDQIEHIIVLMMENRSFDHMLGFMMAEDYKIDGLTGKDTNPHPSEQDVRVTDDASISGDLTPDPGHHYPDVNMQIFSNFQARDDGGPKMEGFIRSYNFISHNAQKSRRVMKCFQPGKIPVL